MTPISATWNAWAHWKRSTTVRRSSCRSRPLPLLKTRRTGPISYRAIQIAAGNVTARPDEHTISLGAIEAALTSGELEQDAIDEVLTDLADLPVELETISEICTEKLKEAEAKAAPPNYEALATLLQEIGTELNVRLGRISPEAEDTEADETAEDACRTPKPVTAGCGPTGDP